MKNIHIGYGDSATSCLLEAIKSYGLPGDSAVPSRDDFTQGPISECLMPNGLQQRIEYWQAINDVLGFQFEPDEFYQRSIAILDGLETDEVTLWVGDSCHDILATGWLISFLKEKNFHWFMVNLAKVDKNDMPDQEPVVNLAMYRPDQLNGLYDYRKPITKSDKAYYTSAWDKAAEENSSYRIKKGMEIQSVHEDYYDSYLLSHLTDQYQPTAQVIGKILKDGKYQISDTTVEWNIRKLINRGLISFQGDFRDARSYSIRTVITEQFS